MIIRGNALTLLSPEIVQACDVMITDPPYSRHVHKSAVSQSRKRGARKREFGFEHLSPALRRALARWSAQVKRWTVLYSDVEGSTYLRIACSAAGARYMRTVPWVRWSMPQLSGDRPAQGFEHVLCFHRDAKGPKHWNGSGGLVSLDHEGEPTPAERPARCVVCLKEWSEYESRQGCTEFALHSWESPASPPAESLPPFALDHKALRGEEKHKAEKPLDQCLDLVSWFSDPGEIVLDPCAGAGTIGQACRLLGRRYVGIEQSEEWARKGNARLVSRLTETELERCDRYLNASEQGSEPETENAIRRAQARAADKDRVRAVVAWHSQAPAHRSE